MRRRLNSLLVYAPGCSGAGLQQGLAGVVWVMREEMLPEPP